jgi:hypothetical protein
MAIDPPQQPPNNRQLMPAAADHPVSRTAHTCPHSRGPRRPQLVLPLSSPPLQMPGAPRTDTDLRMRPRPHQVTVLELTTAAPARRRCRLRRLLRNGHTCHHLPRRAKRPAPSRLGPGQSQGDRQRGSTTPDRPASLTAWARAWAWTSRQAGDSCHRTETDWAAIENSPRPPPRI